MQLLNERTQVRAVAQSWAAQYGRGTYGADTRGRLVGEELLALNTETATAEEVAEITANTSWVSAKACGECGAQLWDIVQIGETPISVDSCTAYLCRKCLVDAIELIDAGDT